MIKNFNHQTVEAEDYRTLLVKFKNGAILTMKGMVNCFKENYKETLLVIVEKGVVEIGGLALDKVIAWKFQDSKEYDNDIWVSENDTTSLYGYGHKHIYNATYNCINMVKILKSMQRKL